MNGIEDKIMTLDQAIAWSRDIQAAGGKLVVTNGVFDLLHLGHVKYLNEAASCGDKLLVAMNSDASVKSIKGPTRPIVSEYDRAYILASLQFVDAVVMFDAPKPIEIFKNIHPNVYVKGGDYTEETLDREEYGYLKADNPKFVFVPFVKEHSTTATIHKVRGEHSGQALPEGVPVNMQVEDEALEALDVRLTGIYCRRSIRSFQRRPVDDRLVKSILTGALAGPTACARKSVRYYVLKDDARRAEIASVLDNGHFLADAPMGLLACGDISQANGGLESYMLQDVAASVENALLSIHALSLGGCWLGIHPRQQRIDGIRRILALPETIIPVAAIALGWPGQDVPARTRYSSDFITWI